MNSYFQKHGDFPFLRPDVSPYYSTPSSTPSRTPLRVEENRYEVDANKEKPQEPKRVESGSVRTNDGNGRIEEV